ncbi:hypothetical protein ACFP7A_12945 [Sporolactobacillus kofuensis]|uniref:Uncharacterized protein n=1 Tax=Sporolactobacillus kofuensis TaxID=269672 RepID=A0ABW1WIM9_9BACL|nr:hypothetical protein [Sporolactobacillus kofuensis]MCO7176956.1 hypothetical protein [Sporolactobacillus kofuensis]
MAMTEEEEKKELRRAQSAFRTAKTYVNRYGDPEGLRELKSLIEEKLGEAPAEEKEVPREEQLVEKELHSVRQELAALRDAQQTASDQVSNTAAELAAMRKTQLSQGKKIEEAADAPAIAGGAIATTIVIAVIFFIKSFF